MELMAIGSFGPPETVELDEPEWARLRELADDFGCLLPDDRYGLHDVEPDGLRSAYTWYWDIAYEDGLVEAESPVVQRALHILQLAGDCHMRVFVRPFGP